MSHTPGPWHLDDGCVKEPAGSCVVCFGHDYDDYGGIFAPYRFSFKDINYDRNHPAYQAHKAEVEANEYLVAAAPELLAALKMILLTHDATCKGEDCHIGGIDLARVAIQKAEGR